MIQFLALIALAALAYHGADPDYTGFEIVQHGKRLAGWTANGTTCDDPDVVLHGNASFTKYLAQNWLA